MLFQYRQMTPGMEMYATQAEEVYQWLLVVLLLKYNFSKT